MTYPSDAASDGTLHTQVNNLKSNLVNSISAAATTLTLSDSSSWPGTGLMTIDTESMEYTSNNTGTGVISGITRGLSGTSANIHDAGVEVKGAISSAYHNRMAANMIGITGDLRNSIKEDLDDTATPAATATSIENRFDQFGNLMKTTHGGTDWKTPNDSIDDTVSATTTSTSVSTRIDMVANRIKAMAGTTSWASAGSLIPTIRQIKVTETSTPFITSANSFTDTGFGLSITPATTTSNIFLLMSSDFDAPHTDGGFLITFLRDGTSLVGGAGDMARFRQPSTGSPLQALHFSFSHNDVPGTIGSVSYRVAFRSINAGQTVAAFATGLNNLIGFEFIP